MVLFESVIQPRRRSIWIVPESWPDVPYPGPAGAAPGVFIRDMVPRIEM
jgi:hypothetical protein